MVEVITNRNLPLINLKDSSNAYSNDSASCIINGLYLISYTFDFDDKKCI